MNNFIKGIFVGIFNIIPGLSGSVLLIILNLYEKCIKSISNIIKKPKENFKFLFQIGFGIFIGTFLFSKIILLLLENYFSETFIVFVGFILGTLPHLFKEAVKKGFNENYMISFIISLALGILLLFFDNKDMTYKINYDLFSLTKYFFIGVVLSVATVIPGISSTILLSLFNLYGVYISSISSVNLFVLIPTLIGLIITTFLLSKIINYLLTNYYGHTYFAILGFTISTIPSLITYDIVINKAFIISMLLGLIAFFISNYTFKIINNK